VCSSDLADSERDEPGTTQEVEMADVSTQVIVASYDDPEGASRALQALNQAKKEKQVDFAEAAVVTSDADGSVKIKETSDMTGGKGAKVGAIVGGTIGILAGPIGWAALGGAAVGGLMAKVKDGGFKDDNLRSLGEALKPGSSALITVSEQNWVAEIEKRLSQGGAKTVKTALKDDIAAQFKSGQSPAYSMLESGQIVAEAPADQPAAPAEASAGMSPG